MSWTKFLTQTCAIERQSTTVLATGEEITTFATVSSGHLCMLQSKSGKRVHTEGGAHTASTQTLYLFPGVDIREGDRVRVDGGAALDVVLVDVIRHVVPHHIEVKVDTPFIEVA